MRWMGSLLLIKSFKISITILAIVIGITTSCFASDKFIAVVYHDITNKATTKDDIATQEFMKQLDFFKANGFRPISIKDLQEAARGKKTLPEKAILLTFDDAYISFYKVVYPALKLFNYPAVLSVVTSWIDKKTPGAFYAKKHFMNWDQIKEVADSGLVTIASHSNNLHIFIDANPQGNKEESPYTFHYDPSTKKYETDEQFRERIRSDLAQGQKIFAQRLGFKPIVLTWPFGAYNQIGVAEGKKLGFQIFLTLDSGLGDVKHLDQVGRYYAFPLPYWATDFKGDLKNNLVPKTFLRAVQIDLDKVVVPGDYEASNQNLGKCIDRLVKLGVNTVFIQGFCDVEGTGNVSSLYFANSVLPVKMDFLNHAVNRIKSREISVYAWMPALSFVLPNPQQNDELLVREFRHGQIGKTTDSYQRLSPFDSRSLEISRRIFRDLAAHVNLDGVLFQDDVFLTDHEDFHPSAAAVFKKALGMELTPATVENDQIKTQWIQLKTKTLDNYISELARTIHIYRPTAKIARNIYSEAVTNPASQEWFAQNLEAYLHNYDYTVIMAYPQMEKIGGRWTKFGGRGKIKNWMQELIDRVNIYHGLNKTIFKVQAFNWASDKWIDAETLKNEISYLLSLGARNVAYYPDGVIENEPRCQDIAPIISGRDFSRDSVTSISPQLMTK
jgi:biofilm PGA synthesis lipoprotein PgaB